MFKSIKKMFRKKSKFTLVMKNHFKVYSGENRGYEKKKFYYDYIQPLMEKYDVIVFDFGELSYYTLSVSQLMWGITEQYTLTGGDVSELIGRFKRVNAKVDYLHDSNKSPDTFIKNLIESDKLEKEIKNKSSQYFTLLKNEVESIKKQNDKPILWVFDFDGTLFNNALGAPYINPTGFEIEWNILSYRPNREYLLIRDLMGLDGCWRNNIILCPDCEFDGDTTNLTKIAKFKIRKIKELSSYYVKNRIIYVDNKIALTDRMADFGFTDSMTLPQFIETVKDKSFPDLTRKY